MSAAVTPADDWYEEPEEAARRRELGLRPIVYIDNDSVKRSHPDQRPCPPWCWVGQHPEYDHEIDPGHPFAATHATHDRLSCVASLYEGERGRSGGAEGKGYVAPATVEADLQQEGQGEPVIRLYLRHGAYAAGRAVDRRRFDELLRLTPADAREVAAILTHLADLADTKAATAAE